MATRLHDTERLLGQTGMVQIWTLNHGLTAWWPLLNITGRRQGLA